MFSAQLFHYPKEISLPSHYQPISDKIPFPQFDNN